MPRSVDHAVNSNTQDLRVKMSTVRDDVELVCQTKPGKGPRSRVCGFCAWTHRWWSIFDLIIRVQILSILRHCRICGSCWHIFGPSLYFCSGLVKCDDFLGYFSLFQSRCFLETPPRGTCSGKPPMTFEIVIERPAWASRVPWCGYHAMERCVPLDVMHILAGVLNSFVHCFSLRTVPLK